MAKVLTVTAEQAKKIGLLTAHTNSQYPILYEPISGANLKETGVGETIEIPRPTELAGLERLAAMGLCTLADEVVAVTGVTLDKDTMELIAGGATGTLVATVAPESATNKAVTWTSDTPVVATVSDDGVVTPNTAGTATITVSTEDGLKTDTCAVTVITLSMKSFTPLATVQAGSTADPTYNDAAAVIAALPATITVTLEDDTTTAEIPVTWADTDTYNTGVADLYTFTASWGALPVGVDNADTITPPTVEVEITAG